MLDDVIDELTKLKIKVYIEEKDKVKVRMIDLSIKLIKLIKETYYV